MKKATLIGLIGVIVVALVNLYYLIRNLTSDWEVPAEYIIPNILSIVGWCGLVYFFFELYKRQK